MTEVKLCYRCNRNYKSSKGHVRQFHENDAYNLFANRHISRLPNDLACDICKTFIEESPRKHVELVHRGRACDEFAKTLDEGIT